MTKKNESEAAQAKQEALLAYDALLQQKSLLLATLTAEGTPDISYAPFVADDQSFYVFVSELASHTQQMLTKPNVSILLVQDEQDTRQIYARQRVSFNCEVCAQDLTTPSSQQVLDALEARHGQVVGLLRGLADFKLMRLVPKQGRLVTGFGRAYEVNLEGGLALTIEQLSLVEAAAKPK